jgi:hypothetical protein
LRWLEKTYSDKKDKVLEKYDTTKSSRITGKNKGAVNIAFN